MQILSQLPPKHYLTGAMVIGFMEVIDGLFALSGFRGDIATAFSLVELLWFLMSLLYLLAFQKQGMPLLIPSIYIIYTIFSWLYGSYRVTQISTGDALQLPEWFMFLATGFGFSYCMSAFYFYKKSFLRNN